MRKLRTLLEQFDESVKCECGMAECKDCGELEEEANTTSNLDGGEGPQRTPFAFQGGRASDKAKEDQNIAATPFSRAEKTNRYFQKMEAMYDRIGQQIDRLSEVAYKDFAGAPGATHQQKINRTIQEIARRLNEVERMIDHSAKLKKESGADQTVFWKSTATRFTKISERLLRIGSKIREFNQ
jgi:uncharacterized protein YukE